MATPNFDAMNPTQAPSTSLSVGLYFGSFNPIHLGHLVIANHMLQPKRNLDEVWFVVTPTSPHKQRVSELIPEAASALQMARLAIGRSSPPQGHRRGVCNLPRPNYTADTMQHLRDAHPEVMFSIIMGQDNLASFHTWKDHDVPRRPRTSPVSSILA